ncbi:HAMP domain-containing histidine kinase [Candidatus Kaiserbacteria bacterium]|nr:HAMP domain-containing histidine kinase [Candidatus Kaiserbacteria bacterium]USN92355.1 MAG: HAMP domain-containing histidine kinase [Candidatus Nomurabacteria bacterium]
MINILKPFAVSATLSKTNEFEKATRKLTFYYVLSTAIILLISSVSILVLFSPAEESGTKPTFEFFEDEVEEDYLLHEKWNTYEFREHLSSVIALVDIIILLLVSMTSYQFSKRTLRPIKENQDRQQQFLGDVAHELRTPLSVIQLGACTMLHKEQKTKKYQEFILDVKEESERLTRLANQLLQLLRSDSLTIDDNVTIQNLTTITQKELERFFYYADQKNIVISSDMDKDVKLMIDADSYIQLLQNILKNAVDYNKKNGNIRVGLKQTGNTVELVVEDTGIGIPNDKLETVFSRFTKLDTSRKQTSENGAGLGLSIVRNIADKIGAEIDLVSEIGKGTKMTVTIPSSS